MKLNWGHGIFIAIVLFMGMIISYVVVMMSSASADHRLVEQDYFKKDLAYQNIIDAKSNLNILSDTVVVEQNEQKLHIYLPTSHAKGKVTLQRMEQVDMDKVIEFETTEVHLDIDKLKKGIWLYSISWADLEKNYYYKSKFVLK